MAIYCWQWALLLGMVCFPNDTPSESTNFSFARGYPCRQLLCQGWGPVPPIPSSYRTPSSADSYKLCSFFFILCEFICATVLLFLESLALLVTSILNGLWNFSAPSSKKFPQLQIEKFEGDISFRTGCFKISHTLYIVQLWVSAFVPTCCRMKLL